MKTDIPTEELLKRIGQQLAIRASAAGLSNVELARLSGVNRNTVSNALSGGDTRLSTLIRLSRQIGYTDWLNDLIETPDDTPVQQFQAMQQRQTTDERRRKNSTPAVKPAPRPLGRRPNNTRVSRRYVIEHA